MKNTNKEIKMHPEQPECRFCGGCQDNYKSFTWLDVQEGRWLEDMGDLIASAVEGMKKVPSYSTYCHEKLASSKGLYS